MGGDGLFFGRKWLINVFIAGTLSIFYMKLLCFCKHGKSEPISSLTFPIFSPYFSRFCEIKGKFCAVVPSKKSMSFENFLADFILGSQIDVHEIDLKYQSYPATTNEPVISEPINFAAILKSKNVFFTFLISSDNFF